jgi:hypothetical protein
MSAYNQEYNKDESILRYVIVATLAELRNKVFYYNRVSEDTLQKIEVPFYYSVTGDERFLTDNFVYDSISEGKAIGDYEVVPRGVLQLSSLSIDSGSQTNKFVKGQFVKEVNGVLRTFAVDTNFLPLNITFSITVVCSNNLEMLKVTESILSKLYKTTTYSVDLGMFRVQAGMAVPEDYSQDKLFEFGLNDKKEFNVTFDLEVQSFVPVFEGGILLSEIGEMLRNANTDAEGVGLIRSNAAGEKGIYFGGIFLKFEYSEDNIKKAPISVENNLSSNIGYKNPDEIRTGDIYIESVIDSTPIIPEAEESKIYRNAKGENL